MEYRRLGKSGMSVSEIALGSWFWAGKQRDESDAVAIHLRARDLGVNFFDTADVYEQGVAESFVGKALKSMNRDEVVIATKCRGNMGKGPNMQGLSKKHIIAACDASLKRLGTDFIDLYQFHWTDPSVRLEESLIALGCLLRQGKILYWGISNYNARETADVVRTAEKLGIEPPVSHQPKYNMFKSDIETDGTMDCCGREGLGLIVYSPLEQGLLTGKYSTAADATEGTRFALRGNDVASQHLTDYNFKALSALKAIAADASLTMTQLALAWILRKKEVSAAIVGATKIEHIENNVAASGVTLSDDCIKQITRVLDTRWATIKIGDFKTVLDADK